MRLKFGVLFHLNPVVIKTRKVNFKKPNFSRVYSWRAPIVYITVQRMPYFKCCINTDYVHVCVQQHW